MILDVPHRGYHWNGITTSFFEGWYFRLTLPEIRQSFAFMYSIQDPIGGQKYSGGAVQLLGIDEQYLCRTFPNVKRFYAAKNSLSLTHWGATDLSIPTRLLPAAKFYDRISEGYQVTSDLHQGSIYDPVQNSYCRWQYQVTPVYGWGNQGETQLPTAGMLAYLPIFEPGWQIIMAHGLATGWIDWYEQRYQFDNVPIYGEKNWGGSFPQQWFWLNCNNFSDRSDLTVTAAGGIRKVLWWQEEVALVGIHYQGKFYQFAPWDSQINWKVTSWGEWNINAENESFKLKLIGHTDLPGTYVRTPTANGLVFNCRDTTRGNLSLTLLDRSGATILEADSNLAGLEVGSSLWDK